MPSQAGRHIKTTVGQNIKAARASKNWTQRDLANALDTDAFSVSRWERGTVMPSLGNLARVAEHLDVTPDWLLVPHQGGSGAA